MSDYLYKAFVPYKNGKQQICLNSQIISGKWVWGSYIPANECCDKHICQDILPPSLIRSMMFWLKSLLFIKSSIHTCMR